jgi:hypothetical protein
MQSRLKSAEPEVSKASNTAEIRLLALDLTVWRPACLSTARSPQGAEGPH